MGSPSRNVQYHPPRLSEDRLNLPQPHSPSFAYTLLREIGNAPVDWVREIRERCEEQNVAFFFKQWGGTRKKLAGRRLDGRTWDARPAARAPVGEQEQQEHSANVPVESI